MPRTITQSKTTTGKTLRPGLGLAAATCMAALMGATGAVIAAGWSHRGRLRIVK